MKVLGQQLYTAPAYAKVLEWGKLVTFTSSAQIVMQAVGLISGILVIRLLPSQEYALYTLANTMLATMTLLADGGVSTSIMSHGGKVWKDREKLGTVLSTGLDLRKRFALVSVVIAMPVLLYILRHHGAGWTISLFILISVLPAFYAALVGSLLEIALKLRQDIAPLQKLQVRVSLGRLLLLGLTVFTFPWAFVAILAAGLPQVWANIRLRKMSAVYVDLEQVPDPVIKKEIISFIKRILPGMVYYCLYGQTVIWLLSVFGSTKAIAQIGALGRLSMILNLFSVLFATLVLPRFARLPDHPGLLLKKYMQIIGGFLSLSACIVCMAWLFPSEILWILGKDYADLKNELVLNIAGSCLGLVAGVSFGLYTSRGWAINPFISVPVGIGSIAAGILMFEISTLQGVLVFNIFIVSIQLVLNGLYGFKKIVEKT